ncbi:MAG: hypothetical protein R3F29_00545 [Planctomycetota bacterium]
MIWTAALLLVLACIGLLRVLRVPTRAGEVLARTRRAVADIRSTTMSDLDKERAMRGHAGALLVQFVVITALSAVAVALPIGALWLLAQTGALDFDAVMEATVSWQVLLLGTVLGLAVLLVGRKRS